MSIDVDRRDGVLVVQLCRPEKRNAIDEDMTAGLSAALDLLDDDATLRVGVVTGGADGFSAGTDLRVRDRRALRTPRGGEYGMIRRDRRKPLIAAVERFALGGGFEIVLACDLVVAASDAMFGLPEVRRGLVASCGGLFRTSRVLPAAVAAELVLVGEPLGAERLHQLGLVNVLTEAGAALDGALRLADAIGRNGPLAVQESLRVLRGTAGLADGEAWARSDEAVDVVARSADAREGIRAFFEKRSPDWRGR